MRTLAPEASASANSATSTRSNPQISLRGLVLPVGGIREKVLAALASGITQVILPARNRHDWEEVPASARERLQVVWAGDVGEVLSHALLGPAGVVEAVT